MKRVSDTKRVLAATLFAGIVGSAIGVLPVWAAGDQLTIALI